MPTQIANLPENFYFGGGAHETVITPLAASFFFAALVLTLAFPRKYAIFPFMTAALLIPEGQVLVLAGFHFPLYRLLLVGGWGRILWTRLSSGRGVLPKLNKIDRVFLAWAFANATTYTLLWGVGALTNRLGFLYTTVGVYFWFRYLIRDWDDIIRVIKTLSVITAIVGAGMYVEHSTGINEFYSVLEGTVAFSTVRDGQVRAQGPFLQSIVAGTFGAVLVPLFLMLWRERQNSRILALLGITGSTVITISCSSSTPLMSYVAGLMGLCFWPMRRRMRKVRWGIVFALLILQGSMTSPIWWIFARLGGVLGGSGWHRSELIDEFLRHFSQWCLLGSRDSGTWGADTWDCIDAYVRAGVDGGLITFTLFLLLITKAFKSIGRARKNAEGSYREERILWSLGACLFANTIAFFGIIYFDQSVIVWYALLAMISGGSSFEVPKESQLLRSAALKQRSRTTENKTWETVLAERNARAVLSLG